MGLLKRLAPPKFKEGDIVQFALAKGFLPPKSLDPESEGTVLKVYIHKNKTGSRRHYVSVQWHKNEEVLDVDQSRLKITERVIKPLTLDKKETEDKVSDSFEVNNIESIPEKEVFTVKTNGGYLGCANFKEGVCLSNKKYSTAFAAANAARKLRAVLSNGARKLQEGSSAIKADENSKVSKTKTKKTNKSVVVNNKRRVRLRPELYTLEDTFTMPLLSFQEVWVITRRGEYVKDSLNKEKKRLVAYTKDKSLAQIFNDHEVAKRTMRVLKGVVGPGFELARFWIEND